MFRSKPNIKLEDYLFTGKESEVELKERMACPITRICNIYKIIDANGQYIPFRPNEAQLRILEMLYIEKVRRLCIPKSRQRGVSTILSIICSDVTYFSDEPVRAGIIDLTHADAKDKIKKCRDALEGLPEELKPKAYDPDSTETIGFQNKADIITKNIRGKTVQILFVSEFGKICFKDPERANEIQSGAFKAASGSKSIIVCESSFEGGESGQFFDYIQEALTTPEHLRTDLTWSVVFFPWYEKKENRLKGNIESVEPDVMEYLKEKEKEIGIEFDDEQKIWYAQERRTQKLWMFREEPTTIDECWKAPIEGSIYGDLLAKSLADGRVLPMAFQKSHPIYASFDLGGPMNTACWLWQVVGPNLYAMRAWGKGICQTQRDWVNLWKDSGIRVDHVFLPHDGDTRHSTGISVRQAFIDADPTLKVTTIERTAYFKNAWDDINYGHKIWEQIYFERDGTEDGRKQLKAYRTKENAGTNIIVKDGSDHWADAMQTFFQAHGQGHIPNWEKAFKASKYRPGDDYEYPWQGNRKRRGRLIARGGFRFVGQ